MLENLIKEKAASLSDADKKNRIAEKLKEAGISCAAKSRDINHRCSEE